MTRRTTPPLGGRTGAAIGRLGRRGGECRSALCRLATREDINATLREMRPSHLRPDMPLCHAKDLCVPKTFREARDGEHGVEFMDAARREVFGLLEAGAFEIVDE